MGHSWSLPLLGGKGRRELVEEALSLPDESTSSFATEEPPRETREPQRTNLLPRANMTRKERSLQTTDGGRGKLLARAMEFRGRGSAGPVLVYTSSQSRIPEALGALAGANFKAAALLGSESVQTRAQITDSLYKGALEALVVTEVSCRGAGLTGASLLVNFEAPATPDSYSRRMGAAAKDAVVLTFFTPADEEIAAHLNIPPIPDVLF